MVLKGDEQGWLCPPEVGSAGIFGLHAIGGGELLVSSGWRPGMSWNTGVSWNTLLHEGQPPPRITWNQGWDIPLWKKLGLSKTQWHQPHIIHLWSPTTWGQAVSALGHSVGILSPSAEISDSLCFILSEFSTPSDLESFQRALFWRYSSWKSLISVEVFCKLCVERLTLFSVSFCFTSFPDLRMHLLFFLLPWETQCTLSPLPCWAGRPCDLKGRAGWFPV